ncbi:hypothetical protein HaLaN_06530 [Haematococcus lacustris]|uniref:Uncharacterized protein n=1 Tax=Haematococcus lacustris TaxID=44745 RepID=A0A699YLV0_HAELA|nr:hypothetical protein HaLaN_06530 [Haematococcus lacustris]
MDTEPVDTDQPVEHEEHEGLEDDQQLDADMCFFVSMTRGKMSDEAQQQWQQQYGS